MRHALTVALQDYTGALVVVSHDRHLLRTTTDQLILVANGSVTKFEGDLADYRQLLLDSRRDSRRDSKKKKTAQPREQRRPLQNRLKNLEKTLDKLTTEKAAIEALLSDPSCYDNQAKLNEYITQQAALTEELEKTEEMWLDVSEALEAF
jgi:ATP-binding cassette subfamily F protein 3